MARAGVPADVTLPGNLPGRRSFHSLRHSFTSWLAEADIHADIRQKLTGHSSAGVHARYVHHDDALARAIQTLPDLPSKAAE
jgi:integrase